MASYNIFGYVRSNENNNGISNVTVSITDNSGSEVGISSVTTNNQGYFQFVFDESAVGGITPLYFSVSDAAGNIILEHTDSIAWTPGYVGSVNIFVDENIAVPTTITGKIRHASGNPISDSISFSNVDIYLVSFRDHQLLGSVPVEDNTYFTFTCADNIGSTTSSQGIKAVVSIVGGGEYSSNVINNVNGNIINVEIVVSDTDTSYYAKPEYEQISNKLTDILQGNDISSIDLDTELDFLSAQLFESKNLITAMVKAHQMYDQVEAVEVTSWAAEYFYAILRQNLSSEFSVLLYQPIEVIKEAIQVAISNNIIAYINEGAIDSLLGDFHTLIIRATIAPETANPEKTSTYNSINHITSNETDSSAILKKFQDFHASAKSVDFWEYLTQEAPEYDSIQPELKAVFSASALVLNNAAITKRTYDVLTGNEQTGDPQMPAPYQGTDTSALTQLDLSDWNTIVTNARTNDTGNFFYPESITGEDDTERDTNYAKNIIAYVRGAYPLQYAHKEIQADLSSPFTELKNDLSSFINNNSEFDLRIASIVDIADEFDFTGITDQDAFIEEIASIQRLMTLTTDYQVIAQLASNGINSSIHITRLSTEEFVDTYGSLFDSEDEANDFYALAQTRTMHIMAKAFSMLSLDMFEFNTINSDIEVEGGSGGSSMAFNANNLYAEWRSLFGSIDNCNCAHCQSVYSPSAYFVDLMQFLRKYATGVYDSFDERRPDIKDIELTCKNTNTPIPYIDIVNELLEDLVSFSVSSYNSSTNQNGYFFYLHARQTIADAKIQRAIPEHVNTDGVTLTIPTSTTTSFTESVSSPYPTLMYNVYPWNSPYNFYKRQIDEHLTLSDAKGYELLQRFSSMGFLEAWDNIDFCSEYLNLSPYDRYIITGYLISTSSNELYEFYGFKVDTGSTLFSLPDPAARGTVYPSSGSITTSDWRTRLGSRVDVFLQQTGLEYVELLELLDCYTINPLISQTRIMAILPNATGIAEDTCNLNELKIYGLEDTGTLDILSLLFRFVRLKRTLGWTYYELDNVMLSIDATDIDENTLKGIAQVKYLVDTLRLPVEMATLLWSNIKELVYRDYRKSEPVDLPTQYEKIFRNPLLSNITASGYPFQETPTNTVDADILLHYLSGIFNIPSSDLYKLLEIIYSELGISSASSIDINISRLSLIAKEISLIKTLGISVQDWVFYKQWITDDKYYGGVEPPSSPFDSTALPFANPYNTIRFISFVKTIANAGLKTNDLDYLLRDKPIDAIWDANNNEKISSLLTSLRGELAKRKKVYSAVYDIDTSELEVMLQQIMTSNNAAKLKNIIQKPSLSSSPSYTQSEIDFITDELDYILPDGVDALATPAGGDYIDEVINRRFYVYNLLQAFIADVTDVKPEFLGEILEQIMPESNADMLLDIIQRTESGSPSYTAEEQAFVDEDVRYLIPEGGKAILTDTTDPDYLSNTTDRRLYVYNISRSYLSGVVDIAMNDLESILLQIMSPEDSAQLKIIIQKPSEAENAEYTNAEREFITDNMSFLFPSEALDILTIESGNSPEPAYIDSIKERRLYVYTFASSYLEENVLKPYIANFFSKEYKIDQDIVTLLLEDCISVNTSGTVNGFSTLMDAQFISSINEITRWDENTLEAVKVTLLLSKTSILINTFSLGLIDVEQLWNKVTISGIPTISDMPFRPDTDTLPVPDSVAEVMPITFASFALLVRWMSVRAFVGKEMSMIYSCISSLVDNNKTVTKSVITDAFKISHEDVEALLGDTSPATTGILDVTYLSADDFKQYRNPYLYLRIIDCLKTQQQLLAPMATISKAAQYIQSASSQEHANEIIQIIKARYNEDAWLEAVQPVSDQLRMERRDAMIAFLLHNPPLNYKTQWYTSNDIYETLMIDVEMMPCMTTTRVLSATNTTQLWVDRVLLGLEKRKVSGSYQLIQLQPDQARQWVNWRKLYRVWEANRKVFIYPENWIEPELRDNKSPFFKELEKFLQQNEINDQNVQDAYKTYLEQLEEVSRLEIVGFEREFILGYPSTETEKIHVFGRTPSHPHTYYYRKRYLGEWSAWEKMNVEIDSDYVIPVLHKGKLRFYWLEFARYQKHTGGNAVAAKETYPVPDPVCWKINLAWTELRNNIWTAKEVSKDPIYSAEVFEEDPSHPWHVQWYGYNDNRRLWHLKGEFERIKKNIVFFYRRNSDGSISFDVQHQVIRLSSPYLNYHTNNWVQRTYHQMNNWSFSPQSGTSYNWTGQGQLYSYDSNEKQSFRDMIDDLRNNVRKQDMFPFFAGRFTVKGSSVVSEEGVSYWSYFTHLLDGFKNPYQYNNSSAFKYNASSWSGYTHTPSYIWGSVQLLQFAPDTDWGKKRGKSVLLHKEDNGSDKPYIQPYFFYDDYDNNFFVQPSTYEMPWYWPYTISIPCYRFDDFRYNQIHEIKNKLNDEDFEKFFAYSYQYTLSTTDTIDFINVYSPAYTHPLHHPKDSLSFKFDNPNSIYNWELYYHIPMLIANRLSQNQKFDEARKWYHYVFNPISSNNQSPADFWNFLEFKNNAVNVPSPLDIMKDPNLQSAVNQWAENPFNPHLIARTRITAYMKNTVMKYLDNLILWGDMLYRRDTRESINEATLLYVLAAQLLGRKPASIPARAIPAVQTFRMLKIANKFNAFSNAMVKIESLLLPSGSTGILVPKPTGGYKPVNVIPTSDMFFFCIPKNEKLGSYWDIVGDRLFKIRNCQTIDGIERELALFDPPIDPAILVKAAASGISLNDALADLNAPLPLYRFRVLSQKATELTQEVKSLGSQLLTALEKNDAEYLAVLRSTQEIKVLEVATEIKEKQIEEAQLEIASLVEQKKIPTQRRDYYNGLINSGLNPQETAQLQYMQDNMPLHKNQGRSQTLSSTLNLIPSFSAGAPTAFTISFGGSNLGAAAGAVASHFGTLSNVNADQLAMAGVKAGFLRRAEDWKHQLKLAELELEQIDKQVVTAQLKKAIAEVELKNHNLQIRNAKEISEEMQNKYTNQDLYNWMIGQISFTYFQFYKLAYETAKKAEKCYRHELSISTSDFIRFGYWDSLKKGLLAGEQLMYDIKRMEVSYLEKNKRQFELSKDISLASLNPDALIDLRLKKGCTVEIPEWLFDMDYPGQHMRRIKSVSVSIPCVAGPYTTIACKLTLLNSKYRKDSTLGGAEAYEEDVNNDSRFTYMYGNIQSITTSHAQNDNGMFEFNFQDERYLPFEGTGAISRWKIELPAAYAQFDYNSISDIILHVNYTALDNGALKSYAKTHINDLLEDLGTEMVLSRMFNLRSEFSTEWHQLMYGVDHKLVLNSIKDRLPYLVQHVSNFTVSKIEIFVNKGSLTIDLNNNNLGTGVQVGTSGYYKHILSSGCPDFSNAWEITMSLSGNPVTSTDVNDAWMVIHYKAEV